MNFDRSKYKVITWKNIAMIHWIINPGLAINELVLGQRIPKISLEDRTIDKPRFERSLVPCPHCETLHDARIWSRENGTAFQNWFGLYCPKCRHIIPCLRNIFSFLILTITYPIWGWFHKKLKSRWMEKQPKRYEDIQIEKVFNPAKNYNWVLQGLAWGGFMFLFMSIIFPISQNEELTSRNLFIGVIIWTIGGLIFGYFNKFFMSRKPKKKTENR